MMKCRTTKMMVFGVTFLVLFEESLSNPKCMIDQCKDCDFKNVYTCNQCEPGYYIRNYYGDEKGKRYQDCWSKNKLAWLLLTLTMLPCCYLGCCYALYRYAQTHIKVKDPTPNIKYENKTQIEEPSQQQPVLVNNNVPQNQAPVQPIQGQNIPQIPPQAAMALDHPSVQHNSNPIRPRTNNIVSPNQSMIPRKKYPSKSILKNQPREMISQPRVGVKRGPMIRRVVEREPYYSDPNDVSYGNELPYEGSPNRSFMQNSGGVRIIEKEPTLIIERSPSRIESNRRVRRNNVGSAPKRITDNRRLPEVSYFDENGHKYRAYRVY